MDFTRTIVIGNSGSGKSRLAERIANSLGAPWVGLDQIYWKPVGYNFACSREHTIALAKDAAASNNWVIEGIYRWLVQGGRTECRGSRLVIANVRHRGVRRGGREDFFNAPLRWTDL